jgi:peptidase M1-like protein
VVRPAPILVAVLLLTLGSAYAQERTPRNANYTIDVRLDASAHTLTARETLVWTNISGKEASELQFHLYYNAWRNDRSSWLREQRLGGGLSSPPKTPAKDFAAIDVSSIKLTGGAIPAADLTASMRFISPDDGNADDRTVMAVTLPSAVQPHQSMTLDISWSSKIPRTFARTGVVGNYFFLGQWFPKIGVLQSDGQWNCHQFHATTEFFSDYGVYDVSMTVPRGWPLAATGEEREHRENADGTTTYRYRQEDVHDFAWTTSPDYLEKREGFEHEGLPPIEMRLMLQPEHAGQAERYFEAARAALRYYGEWFGPYPYGHITIIDPAWQSGADGMEYPTLFTGGTPWLEPDADSDPPDTVVHEAGHQWWYGLVGSNEFEDAWLDEGINTYTNARADAEAGFARFRLVRHYFGGFIPWVFRDIPWDRVTLGDYVSSYRGNPTVDTQSTPSYQYWPGNPTAITYSKTALWLHTLERALGWPTMRQILSTYFQQWQFRHSKPADFFQIANEQSGKDLSPFFDQVYRGSATFDYGVQSVKSVAAEKDAFRTDVVVRRYGDGIFPVTVLVTFSDGGQTRVSWDGGGRWKMVSVDHGSAAVSAQVDPDQILLLDTNFTNNSFTTEPLASRAATKWASKWMVWLQDQLLTWAFFA